MSKTPFQFQFENPFDAGSKLAYQKHAIESVLALFNGVSRDVGGVTSLNRAKQMQERDPIRNPTIVSGSKLLDNLNKIQLDNEIFPSSSVCGNNFCVEMETGTGKTYVYLRTILELYKEYQFKKFIIIVPSVAIRKGIEQSVSQLKDEFARLYDNLDISAATFTYDKNCSVDTVSYRLVESSDISIMITTMQSISGDNKRLKGGDVESRKYGEKKNVWEDLSFIKPVVIVDEPQRVMGMKKDSKTAEAIEEVKPLFTLHYSATPPVRFPRVYEYTSFKAFNENKVKQIQVKTIFGQVPKDYPYVRFSDVTSDLKARVELFTTEQGSGYVSTSIARLNSGDSLYEASGRLPQYKNCYVEENPHKNKPLKISIDGNVSYINKGDSNYDFSGLPIVRLQIRIAIKNHFEKQFAILDKGEKIKALTLFFIDSVSKVRDSSQADNRGEYLRIFDEEYAKAISSAQFKAKFEEYKELFTQYQNVPQVREGYFAVDKNSSIVDIELEENGEDFEDIKFTAKTQEDIDRGIQLILEKKDELIQFTTPLAFIFSHSALREGWDNPNVFTLCTLKSGGSEVAKKQEIGRGLRLAVDTNGKRIYDEDVNILTVVVNDNYEHFAENVQKDFNAKAGFNKDEITFDVLIKTLKLAGIPKPKQTKELIETLREELFSSGIINDKNILTSASKDIEKVHFMDETLKEHCSAIIEKFKKVVADRGSIKIPVKNGDITPITNRMSSYATEEQFDHIMHELANRVKQRTYFKVKIDKDIFIEYAIETLNAEFGNKPLTHSVSVTDGTLGFDRQKKFELKGGIENKERIEIEVSEKSDYEIVNFVMYHTNLPRLAIIRLLKGFKRRDLLNSQEYLDRITYKINELFREEKGKCVSEYEIIKDYVFDEKIIFEANRIENEDLEESKTKVYKTNQSKKKAIFEYYKMDGEGGEYRFAQKLDNHPDVLLWTKFKRGSFFINTPYGEYSPDWGIVAKDNEEPTLYFVVETKIDKTWDMLYPDEKVKILCAKKHFAALGNEKTFNWVDSFDADSKDSFISKVLCK